MPLPEAQLPCPSFLLPSAPFPVTFPLADLLRDFTSLFSSLLKEYAYWVHDAWVRIQGAGLGTGRGGNESPSPAAIFRVLNEKMIK